MDQHHHHHEGHDGHDGHARHRRAGEADIAAIQSPRPLVAVGDGDEVFGLQVIATPGHTAGHISILDTETGLLVAGDALNNTGEVLAGSPPQFTADQAMADASVQKLADLPFDTVLFGHGEPIEGEAGPQVAALASSL